MSLASRYPLRKSCRFCRARKIRCSNGIICDACKKQNVDCVYNWDSWPTKSRTTPQVNTTSSNTDSGPQTGFSVIPGSQRSSTGGSPRSTPIVEEPERMDVTGAGMAAPEDEVKVASVLLQMWNETFAETSSTEPKSNPWQEKIAEYHRTLRLNRQDPPDNVQSKFSPRNAKYTDVLSLLTHDLIGLLVDKFGSLGSIFMEQGGGRFYRTELANDTTETMFDTTPPGPNPLTELGHRQITQMMDVWFSVHPFSFLMSKTLLLRDLRDGSHDEVLLAVILAEASFSIGDEAAVARGQVMLRWAEAQLQSRPFPTGPGSPNAAGISTAQALMLMGWNAFCQYQVRRATCYIGLSGRLATELKDQFSAPAPMATSRINGIDVFEVEKELVAYLYWITYTYTFWAFMQIGGHFPALLPTSLTSIFLPVDESTSVLIRLDEVSDNFSTLQKQKAIIKEMWPLAHIASITAYIYALYPQEPDTNEAASTDFWQEAPLLALQRIRQGSTPQDMASVCREVYRVLMESIRILNRQVSHAPSRSLVLAVYHTLAIHLLFPAPVPGAPPPTDPVGVTAETIKKFIASAEELLNIFDQVCDQSQEPTAIGLPTRNSFPDIFCLALDTCARAMSFIHAQKSGVLPMEPQVLQLYENRLAALANRLHAIAKSDFLVSGGSARIIKKHLKAVMRAFGSQTGLSHGVGQDTSSSSAGTSEGTSSHSHSPPNPLRPAQEADRLSTATPVDSSSYTTPPPSSTCDAAQAGQAETITASGIAIPFQPFSPVSARADLDSSKPDWHAADQLPHHIMDHSVLGPAATTASEHMTLTDLIDAQAGWFRGNQMHIDFDMPGPQLSRSWEWLPSSRAHDAPDPPATANQSDMDNVLHYFQE